MSGCYEHDDISIRLTFNYIAKFVDRTAPAYDGIAQPG